MKKKTSTRESCVPTELADALRAVDLTAQEIASRLGYAESTVRQWLAGTHPPSRRAMHSLQNMAYQAAKKQATQGAAVTKANFNGKLPDQLLAAVRALNLTYAEIAAKSGFAAGTVAHSLGGCRPVSWPFVRAMQQLVEEVDTLRQPGDSRPSVYANADAKHPPLPVEKCVHRPGSVEKIEVLRQRAQAQEHLWSPQDHGYDDEPMGLSY